MFYVFFSLNGLAYVFVPFAPHQTFQAIAFGEATDYAFAMFSCAAGKVICDADVKNAVRFVRYDINPSAFHKKILSQGNSGGNKRRGWPGQARP